jgi:hypothetical protein
MPLYLFRLIDTTAPEDNTEWHPNDVAALRAAAATTAELARNRHDSSTQDPMVVAVRVLQG